MNTRLDLDINERMEDEFLNLFGVSLRSKRRQQQLGELDKVAEEKGISKSKLDNELKKEVATTDGDKSKAISNVFNKLSLGIGTIESLSKDTSKTNTTSDKENINEFSNLAGNVSDSDVRYLGMKPMVAVVVGLVLVSGLATAIFVMIKNKK